MNLLIAVLFQDLIKKKKGEEYVKWDTIIKKARVPTADRTTAAKAFAKHGIPVKFRPNRQKPQRTKEHMKERKTICDRLLDRQCKLLTTFVTTAF